MKNTKTITMLVMLITIIALFINWSIEHDKQTGEAAERYEACVAKEYGQSPSEYRELYGEYPICNFK
jgi:hypothetical protein